MFYEGTFVLLCHYSQCTIGVESIPLCFKNTSHLLFSSRQTLTKIS
jgi:chromosome segregation ATPase